MGSRPLAQRCLPLLAIVAIQACSESSSASSTQPSGKRAPDSQVAPSAAAETDAPRQTSRHVLAAVDGGAQQETPVPASTPEDVSNPRGRACRLALARVKDRQSVELIFTFGPKGERGLRAALRDVPSESYWDLREFEESPLHSLRVRRAALSAMCASPHVHVQSIHP
jgi:hypothetical protein